MKKHFKTATSALLLLTSFGFSHAWASECKDSPGVTLRAVSSEAVANDQIRMHWRAEIEENSASQAMQSANRALKQAVGQLQRDRSIRNVQTNVQTYPVHGQQRTITHWRSVGSLSFELAIEALENKREIKLADPLTLSRMDYFLGKQIREESRARLLNSAMQEFQSKADLVAKGFGHSGYQLAHIQVNDETAGGQGPRPPMMRAMSASPEMSMSPSEVAASGGTSEVSVSVDGQVCLKR